MHKKWQGIRVHGEWFKFANQLKRYVQMLIEKDREQEREASPSL